MLTTPPKYLTHPNRIKLTLPKYLPEAIPKDSVLLKFRHYRKA